MKKIKNSFMAMMLSIIVFMPIKQAQAQIPVTDVIHIAETILQYVTMVEQYANMVERYKVLVQQLEESRGFTEIGVDIGDLLSASRIELYKEAPSKQYEEPLFEVESLFTEDSDAKQDYERRSTFIYGNIAKVNEMYEQVADRKENLDNLRAEIGSAETPKAIMDLNARINAESALLQNDIALISLLKVSMDLSAQALRHDENGRRISELQETSNVN